MSKKPFAIRLLAQNIIDGSTFERVYYRGAMRVNKQAFTEYAIGNLLALISEQDYSNLREFVIMSVITLSPDETFAIWREEAEREIAEQMQKVEDYVRESFPNDYRNG
jgi:queuine/archaeosine tRNA-ribosyltransferase